MRKSLFICFHSSFLLLRRTYTTFLSTAIKDRGIVTVWISQIHLTGNAKCVGCVSDDYGSVLHWDVQYSTMFGD